MPTYDYQCSKCGHEFELFQRMSDEPLNNCPKCNGKVKRLIGTGASIIFKGSGFYATDYRSKEYSEKARKESENIKSSSESKDKPKKSEAAKD